VNNKECASCKYGLCDDDDDDDEYDEYDDDNNSRTEVLVLEAGACNTMTECYC